MYYVHKIKRRVSLVRASIRTQNVSQRNVNCIRWIYLIHNSSNSHHHLFLSQFKLQSEFHMFVCRRNIHTKLNIFDFAKPKCFTLLHAKYVLISNNCSASIWEPKYKRIFRMWTMYVFLYTPLIPWAPSVLSRRTRHRKNLRVYNNQPWHLYIGPNCNHQLWHFNHILSLKKGNNRQLEYVWYLWFKSWLKKIFLYCL